MPLLYWITILAGTELALLHALAEWLTLYWRYAWLDIPMHFFGGVVTVLMLATLRSMAPALTGGLSWRWGSVVAAVLIGWELFGVWRYGGLKPDFWIDSSLDLLFGILGVVAGYYITTALRKLSV